MAVHVHIPVRVRADACTLRRRPDALADALSAAAGRAMRRARATVGPRMGRSPDERFDPPAFTWTGPAARAMDRAARQAVAARLAVTLGDVVARARAGGEPTRDDGSPISLDRRPSETLDRRRFGPRVALYDIPSYEGEGEPTPVPVVVTPGGPIDMAAGLTYEPRFVEVRNAEHFAKLWKYLRETTEDFPSPERRYFGALYRSAGRMWAAVYRGSDGQDVFDAPFSDLQRWEKNPNPADAQKPYLPVPVAFDATVRYWLEYLGPLPPPGPQRSAALERVFGDSLRNTVKADGESQLSRMDPDAARQWVDARVGQILADMASHVPAGATSILQLRCERWTAILYGGPCPADLDAELLPVTEDVRVRVERAGTETDGTGGSGGGTGGGEAKRGGGQGEKGDPAGRDGAGDKGKDGSKGEGEEARSADDLAIEGDGPAREGTQYFPSAGGDNSETLSCEAFLGEPPIDELGADGQRIAGIIERIARRLQMPTCKYPATFAINAARVIAARTTGVARLAGTSSGFTKVAPTPRGGIAGIEFTPAPSPAIQIVRFLAATFPLLTQLSREIHDLYGVGGTHARQLGDYADNRFGWLLRFDIELTPAIEWASANMFGQTCRVLLLQLLRASRKAIEARLVNFSTYAPMFEQMVMNQLMGLSDLLQMRDRLQAATRAQAVAGGIDKYGVGVPAIAWSAAAHAVADALATPPASAATTSTGPAGEVVRDPLGVSRIRDEHGRLWAMDALESAIANRRGLAESIDPLVKQITNVPELAAKLKTSPFTLRLELLRMLTEMYKRNTEMIGKADDSWTFAFRTAAINDESPSTAVAGTTYTLVGIHRVVDEQIGDAFGGDWSYTKGINFLFASEQGRASLIMFGEIVGLSLLAVVCAPAAFVAGVVVAAVEVEAAQEKLRLYGALMDPELILNRAEIEAELFAAYLGLALSFVPELPAVFRTAKYGIRAVGKAGAAGGARIVGRYVARRVTAGVAEQLSKNLMVAFGKELATNLMMDQIMPKILGPVLEQVRREAMVTGSVGGAAGASLVARMLAEEKAAMRKERGQP